MNPKAVTEVAKFPLEKGREGLVWLGKGALTKSLDFVDSRFDNDDKEKDTTSEVLHTVEEISDEPNSEKRKELTARIAELLMRQAEVVCSIKGEVQSEVELISANEIIRKLYSVVMYFAETPRNEAIELVRSEQVANVIKIPTDLNYKN